MNLLFRRRVEKLDIPPGAGVSGSNPMAAVGSCAEEEGAGRSVRRPGEAPPVARANLGRLYFDLEQWRHSDTITDGRPVTDCPLDGSPLRPTLEEEEP